MPVREHSLAPLKPPDLRTHPADCQDSLRGEIEVFFDGDCPLCRREIAFLRRRDRCNRIRFTNIGGHGFVSEQLGVSKSGLMAEIHGRLPDGTWVRGVEVFQRLYAAIGWRRLAAASRWPCIATVLDSAYRVFARNRLRWTGRCTSACNGGEWR